MTSAPAARASRFKFYDSTTELHVPCRSLSFCLFRSLLIFLSAFASEPFANRSKIQRKIESDFHDLGFFVLEMVIDRFDEAVGEFLHIIFHVA